MGRIRLTQPGGFARDSYPRSGIAMTPAQEHLYAVPKRHRATNLVTWGRSDHFARLWHEAGREVTPTGSPPVGGWASGLVQSHRPRIMGRPCSMDGRSASCVSARGNMSSGGNYLCWWVGFGILLFFKFGDARRNSPA